MASEFAAKPEECAKLVCGIGVNSGRLEFALHDARAGSRWASLVLASRQQFERCAAALATNEGGVRLAPHARAGTVQMTSK